jgi:hypothetical protein
MYIRVTAGSADVSRADEVTQWGNDVLMPAIQRLPGFRNYFGGVDRQSGAIVGITLWETEEQARGLRDALDQSVLQQLGELGVRLGDSQVYEVTLQV